MFCVRDTIILFPMNLASLILRSLVVERAQYLCHQGLLVAGRALPSHSIWQRGSRCFCARDDFACIRTSCLLFVLGAVSLTHCFGIARVALSELACASTLGPASVAINFPRLQCRKAPGGIVSSMRTFNCVHYIGSRFMCVLLSLV